MVKKYIPVKLDYSFHTKSIRDKKTGQMMGRERVAGRGDMTPVKRVSRDTDIDKDGDIDFHKGEIVGRESKEKGIIYVKGSKKQRAYTR